MLAIPEPTMVKDPVLEGSVVMLSLMFDSAGDE